MFTLRNSFVELFNLLPENIQKYLKENDGNNLVDLMNRLGHPNNPDNYQSTSLSIPMFGEIYTLVPEKKRPFLPHLTVKTFLKEITKGKDLLDKEKHLEYFKEFVISEADQEELKGFNTFVTKKDQVNDKGTCVFEISSYTYQDFTNKNNLIKFAFRASDYFSQLNTI